MSKLQLNTFIGDMVSPCPKVERPRANKTKAQGTMGTQERGNLLVLQSEK